MFSLEPGELAGFVEAIRNTEVAMGNHLRSLSDEEIVKRNRMGMVASD